MNHLKVVDGHYAQMKKIFWKLNHKNLDSTWFLAFFEEKELYLHGKFLYILQFGLYHFSKLFAYFLALSLIKSELASSA